MSVDLVTWALRQRVSKASDKALLVVAAALAVNDLCDSGQDEIARIAEQSVDSVQRGLARLESLGIVKRLRRGGTGRGRETDIVLLCLDNQALGPAPRPGFFYVVTAAGKLKVGITYDPASRFRTLGRLNGDLTLVGLWRGEASACRRAESTALAGLRGIIPWLGSEWFACEDYNDVGVMSVLMGASASLQPMLRQGGAE